jgi:hypothetical protein
MLSFSYMLAETISYLGPFFHKNCFSKEFETFSAVQHVISIGQFIDWTGSSPSPDHFAKNESFWKQKSKTIQKLGRSRNLRNTFILQEVMGVSY